MMHTLDDSTGLCGFLSSFRGQFGGRVAYHIHNLPTIIELSTGIKMDEHELWETGTRMRNMVRALNVRRGMRRVDEAPPADHWAVRDDAFEQKLLDDYYAYKGWNKEGIPTKETLKSSSSIRGRGLCEERDTPRIAGFLQVNLIQE